MLKKLLNKIKNISQEKNKIKKEIFNHLLDKKEYQCKYKNYTFLVQDNRIYIVQAIGKNDLFELIEEEAKFLLDTSIDNLKEV